MMPDEIVIDLRTSLLHTYRVVVWVCFLGYGMLLGLAHVRAGISPTTFDLAFMVVFGCLWLDDRRRREPIAITVTSQFRSDEDAAAAMGSIIDSAEHRGYAVTITKLEERRPAGSSASGSQVA